MRNRWWHRILAPPALLLLAAGALGLLLRYTIKDRLPVLAAVFYGLPPLVVAVALAAAFALYVVMSRRRWALASGVLTLLATAAWIHTDFVSAAPPESATESLRVVLWNASPLRDPNSGALTILQETDAHLLLLVESGGSSEFHRLRWQSHFPDFHVCMLGPEMTFLSRYPIAEACLYTMGTRTTITVYDLTTPFGVLTVLGVDIESNPLAWRKPFVEQILQIAASKPNPVIILGDFNTPHTSAHFKMLRQYFQNASETSATGLLTTWIAYCPVLALDHIWLSEHFVPIRTTLRRTFHSDHAMVMADVSLEGLTSPHPLTARSTDDE